MLTQSCSSKRSKPHYQKIHAPVNERTGLLASDEESTSHAESNNTISKATTYGTNENSPDYDIVEPKKKTSSKFKTIFTPQSTLTLIVYGMLAMHSMGFDSLFPVFLHHPQQDLVNNPDVELPFRFTSGFGLGTNPLPSPFNSRILIN
jgi:hypothetical protein